MSATTDEKSPEQLALQAVEEEQVVESCTSLISKLKNPPATRLEYIRILKIEVRKMQELQHQAAV